MATVLSATMGGAPIPNLENTTLESRGFGIAECNASSTVELEIALSSLPAGVTYVDMWLGNASDDCSTEAARATGTDRTCVHLGIANLNASEITVGFDDMLDPDDSPCDGTAAVGEKFRLWLLATNATETTTPITASQYVYVTFNVDADVPSVPTPETAMASGDQSIPVTWSGDTDQGALRFNLYVDTSVGTCSDVGQWAAGDPPPSGVEPDVENFSGTTASVNAESLSLSLDQSALVYITALDNAENESNLSTAVCITRVKTVGFCDALADGGEECTNTCAATFPGSRSASGALWLGLVALALVARRRAR